MNRTSSARRPTSPSARRGPTTGWSPSAWCRRRPETGYGYIVPGAPLDADATRVERFQEKPDAATALDLMAAGALWNSGLFAWTADRLAAEVRAHTPELAPWLDRIAAGDVAGVLQGDHAGLHRRRRAGAEPCGGRGAGRLPLG